MEGLTYHFLPQKVLQRQKRYIHRVLFNPRDYKIHEFIFLFNEIIEYLYNILPFRAKRGHPKDEILELVEFALLSKWNDQLLIQGFELHRKNLPNS